jgi:hypothetical protein
MSGALHPLLHYVRGMYNKLALIFIATYSKFYKNVAFLRMFLCVCRQKLVTF